MKQRGQEKALLGAFLLCGTPHPLAWSQSQTPQKQEPTRQAVSRLEVVPTAVPDVGLGGPEFTADVTLGVGLYIVNNQPFSARLIVQTERRLDDGNSIRRESEGKIYRDSRGRVRQDRPVPAGAPQTSTVVSIADRASGLFYQLLPSRRMAFKLTVPAGVEAAGSPETGSSAASSGQPGVSVEAIGYQMLEGFQVKGTRTTVTTPSGTAGNMYPIEVVTERWYSPELQAMLLVRVSDPKSGETVFKLTDVLREEPPTALFEIPPDYRVEEQRMTLSAPSREPRDR